MSVSLLEEILTKNSNKDEVIAALVKLVKTLSTELQESRQELALLKQLYFAPKSEKRQVVEGPSLFEDLEDYDEPQKRAEEISYVPAHVRKKKSHSKRSRLAAIDNLPVVEKVVDLSEDQKTCPKCHNRMTQMGKDVSRRVEMIPPKAYVEKVTRLKYTCRCCNTAPVSATLPYVLPKSMIGNGLFAHILTSKFCDGLPFHRQEKILKRIGIDYSRANMCNNAIQFHHLFGERIEDILISKIKDASLLQIDETSLQVLNEPDRNNTTKSYTWVLLGRGKHPFVLFLYKRTRSAQFLSDMLKSYRGVVITDGYRGYDDVFSFSPIQHAGCHAHVRRYFIQAKLHHEEAEFALNIYSRLYKIERAIKKAGLSPEQIVAKRQKLSKPLIDKLHKWLNKMQIDSSKSHLQKAIHYAINQWPKLTLFLSNGVIPIDNNLAENAIRPFVLGRKNWLFSGSPDGAEATCLLYSLIETAKLNGHEPSKYLKFLFDKLPYVYSNQEIEKLMPFYITPEEINSS